MTTHCNVTGTWRELNGVHNKVAGVWEEAANVYSKVAGVWEEVYASAPPTLPTPTLATSTLALTGGFAGRVKVTNFPVGASVKWWAKVTVVSTYAQQTAWTTAFTVKVAQNTATLPFVSPASVILNDTAGHYGFNLANTWYNTDFGNWMGVGYLDSGGWPGCANAPNGTLSAYAQYSQVGYTNSANSATATRTYDGDSGACCCCCCG